MLGFIVLIGFIKFQIKGAVKSYFFDGSLNVNTPEQLPNNKMKRKLALINGCTYSIQASVIVAFLFIIGTSVEEKNVMLPYHMLDVVIIVFLLTFIISSKIYSEYFDFFRNDFNQKLDNFNNKQ